MTTFSIPESLPQPATCYPFQAGEAVFYLPNPAGFCNKQQLIPAVILKAQPALVTTRYEAPRVSILRQDKTRATSVQGCSLAYRGYCSVCGVPAVLNNEALICPKCYQPATATPPPDELALRLFPIEHAGDSQIARICATTDCTWGEALHARNKRRHDAFYGLLAKYGMLNEMYNRLGPWTEADGQFHWFAAAMHWFAELGDEASFMSYYRQHAPSGELPTERSGRIVSFFKALLGDADDDTGDGPGGPSRRLQLPPLDIERTADDAEPDGADDLTRWLDDQFGQAA